MTFLVVHQLVRMNFSVHSSTRTHDFSVHLSTRTHDFSDRPSARTHDLSYRASARTHKSFNPSTCIHYFLIRQLVRIVPVILSRVVFSTAFTVCAWTKYTPPLLINGSCPSPKLKMHFIAKCVPTPCSHKQLTLKIGFVTFAIWKSYRFV